MEHNGHADLKCDRLLPYKYYNFHTIRSSTLVVPITTFYVMSCESYLFRYRPAPLQVTTHSFKSMFKIIILSIYV